MPPFGPIPTLSKETAHFLACHTLPLGLKGDAKDLPHEVIARATFSLVEIDEKHFFITNAHVWDKYLEIKGEHPKAQLAAYTTIPAFTELSGFHLIDSDSKILDVAIFRGQETRVDLPGRFFIPYNGSYLADPAINEPVCIVGYPSENIEVDPRKAHFDYMQILFPISSISERHVVLADEHGQRIFHDEIDPELTRVDLGGLSGSPAYVLRNHRYRFIGIVKECSQSDQTILISRLGCFHRDGTIDRQRMPY